MAISKVGTFASASSSAVNTTQTLGYTTITLGDLCIVTIAATTGSVSATALSGGGCASWTQVVSGTSQSGSMWTGRVTTVGAVTLTVTFNGSVNSGIDCFQFTNGTGASTVWTVDGTPETSQLTGTTMTYSSLSASVAGELWYGICIPANVGSVGTTSGFTWQKTNTTWSNIIAYQVLATSGAVTAPTATQTNSTPNSYRRLGMIIGASASAASPTGRFFPFMNHHEQQASGELWTPDKPSLVTPRRFGRTVIDLAPARILQLA